MLIGSSWIFNGNIPISETPTAGVVTAKECALHSAACFGCKLLDVQAVDHAVNLHQHFGLLVLRIDSLADCDQTHAGEAQSFVDRQRVLGFAGEAGRIVHEQHIKGARPLLQRSEKPLKAGAVIGRTGDGFVSINMLLENDPDLAVREFPRLPDLILD